MTSPEQIKRHPIGCLFLLLAKNINMCYNKCGT